MFHSIRRDWLLSQLLFKGFFTLVYESAEHIKGLLGGFETVSYRKNVKQDANGIKNVFGLRMISYVFLCVERGFKLSTIPRLMLCLRTHISAIINCCMFG